MALEVKSRKTREIAESKIGNKVVRYDYEYMEGEFDVKSISVRAVSEGSFSVDGTFHAETNNLFLTFHNTGEAEDLSFVNDMHKEMRGIISATKAKKK